MSPENMNQDHDLLIKVDTKLGNLIDEVRLMRDGNERRLSEVERTKLDITVFNDYKVTQQNDLSKFELELNKRLLERDQQYDKRFSELQAVNAAQSLKIEKLIRYLYIGLGVIGTLQFLAPYLVKIFIKY